MNSLRVGAARAAVWLGFGGLIPFVFLAGAALIDTGHAARLTHALLAYGAVILSFVGALHWSFAMTLDGLTADERRGSFVWSVVPALIAWTALLVMPRAAGVLLILGFAAQYWRDRRLEAKTPLAAWYLPLRLRLTVVACVSLAAASVDARASAGSPEGPAMSRASAMPGAPAMADGTAMAGGPATSRYREGAPSAGGIGKFYDGREIAHVMGFEGAEWLERASREREERTDLLIGELKLEPTMTVADIGAGSGYLTRRLSPLVGQGKVYAVDVQPEMVALLKRVAQEPLMHNVVPVLGSSNDVMLPEASIDLAIMVDVYHELAFPFEVVQSIVRSLRAGGRLVLVEYRAEDPSIPIQPLHKMSEQQIRKEMKSSTLTWERTDERLPIQHIVVFRKP